MRGADSLAVISRALAAFASSPGFDVLAPFARERRLHARAYELWVSLLQGRACPKITDLAPRDLADFAPGSVLVELGRGESAPKLHFLGRGLVAEAGIAGETPTLADVPRASLLGQLLRRLPAVREHGGPIGFEAEFDGGAGIPTTYRGVLLPFADDEGEIAYVYGVISWKLVATSEVEIDIVAAVDAALTVLPASEAPSAWGSGPIVAPPAIAPLSLAQQLSTARTWAALTNADRLRRDASLNAALSATHDFLLAADTDPAAFAALLVEAGIAAGPAMGRAIQLVFGAELPRIERARCGAALSHARRLGLGVGRLGELLERYPGGATAFAAAERRARRNAQGMIQAALGRARAETMPAIGRIAFKPIDEDYFVLIGRRSGRGAEIVAAVPDPGRQLAQHALRRLAAD